jgi:hypothetical protein
VVQALVQFEGVTYVVIGTALEVDGVVTGTDEEGTNDTDTDAADTDEVAKLEASAVGVVELMDAG